MRCRRILGLTLVSCLIVALVSVFPPAGRGVTAQGEGELTIRKDSELLVELLSPISAATNKRDDKFSCKIIGPPELSGAIVSGHIQKAKHSGKGNGKSELVLKFDSISLADGRAGALNAQIKQVYDAVNIGDSGQADPEGTVKGKSRIKISVKRAIAGALIGSAIGGAIGGPKGAAEGAMIGMGVAVSTVLVTEGPNLEFRQGTQFLILVNAPARLK